MNDTSFEFNKRLELSIVEGLTNLTMKFVREFDYQRIDEVVIPDHITSIDKSAFCACYGLKKILIPDSVISIGDWAFEYCTGLTNITIPDSVTSIGGGVFYGCSSLISVTIPDSVTSIGDYAFDDRCSYFSHITFKGKTMDEVKAMRYYPWGIYFPEKTIKVQTD